MLFLADLKANIIFIPVPSKSIHLKLDRLYISGRLRFRGKIYRLNIYPKECSVVCITKTKKIQKTNSRRFYILYRVFKKRLSVETRIVTHYIIQRLYILLLIHSFFLIFPLLILQLMVVNNARYILAVT